MKKMLLGIFLLLLSIWCLIFGWTMNAVFIVYVSLFLLIPSIFLFACGYHDYNSAETPSDGSDSKTEDDLVEFEATVDEVKPSENGRGCVHFTVPTSAYQIRLAISDGTEVVWESGEEASIHNITAGQKILVTAENIVIFEPLMTYTNCLKVVLRK